MTNTAALKTEKAQKTVKNLYEENKIANMYKNIHSKKMLKGFFHITGLVSASACSKMKAGEG